MDQYNRRLRQQGFATIGTTDSLLIGPNSRRRAILINSPAPVTNEEANQLVINAAVDTSTTGVKSSFTLPAGQQGTLVQATMFETTGTTVVAALQIVRGGTTINIDGFTKAGVHSGGPSLQAGDKVQWNVTTAVAASITDFTISIQQDALTQRITLSLTGAAVADQGIDLHPGTLPLILTAELVGNSITEEIRGIAVGVSQTIGYIEFSD